jgi:hypothetical protein
VPPVHALPPGTLVAGDRDGEGPEVALRDDVDRRAHQRRLHDLPPLQRPREVTQGEPVEPRPEADVRGRRVLRLQAADSLERPRHRQPGALEQELPRQQRAVQAALAQLHRTPSWATAGTAGRYTGPAAGL